MRYYNINDSLKEDIMSLNYINMFATMCLWGSIWSNYQLFVRWRRSRHIFTEDDTLFNTGLYKNCIFEMFIGMVQPYPFLYNVTYKESFNGVWSDKELSNLEFEINDTLLAGMIILRLYFISRSILNTSNYVEPRAQRVCQLYGCEANFGFSIKVMMKDKPNQLIWTSMGISIFVFAYTTRLFERAIDEDF